MRHDLKPASLVPEVLAIARQAGDAIMGVYAKLLAADAATLAVLVNHKDDGSPLTQADLLAHQTIATRLAALTPDIPVVSEEDTASLQYRKPTGTFWLVDPLDGTKEFLARNGEFTVNIALVQEGRATLGVVLAPALGLAYWGCPGAGAFKEHNGLVQAIRVAVPAEAGSGLLRVLASKSHLNADTQAYLQQLGPHKLVQAGSSLKFCRVAEGSADIYPRLGPTCEWDTAAAQSVVEAAGGEVLELDGTPLRYGKPELLNPYFVAAAPGMVCAPISGAFSA
jgi:3'(2'), 5'-bisphosphate nucleotidase